MYLRFNCQTSNIRMFPSLTRRGLVETVKRMTHHRQNLTGFVFLLCLMASPTHSEIIESDVCIYGGTAGGVAAAMQASRMGKSAVIAEFGSHLGGMSSGGLGATD